MTTAYFSLLMWLLAGLSCFATFMSYAEPGRWIRGDQHIHTALSADARSTLDQVVHQGIETFNLDYMVISNHLRNTSHNNNGDPCVEQLFSSSLADYESPALAALQKTYPQRLLLSTFEWDMPGHDHMNIGILPGLNKADYPQTAQKLKATAYFEYQFGAKNTPKDFSGMQFAAKHYQQASRQNQTHDDAVAALAWLAKEYPGQSYAMLNHPTRYATSYKLADIRDLHNAAPDVFTLVEGMVGNQFNGYRGDYAQKSRAGLAGGVDPFVATLGGNWDALLGEGRRIWLVANSDHHFKAAPPHASGYFPGEYAATWLYLPQARLTAATWLKALKSGNSFSVYGNLIDSLAFSLSSGKQRAEMGQTLNAEAGDNITLTLTVHQPEHNNREKTVGDGRYNGEVPALHHIDVISGEVTGKAAPGSDAYQAEHNPTTRVIKSFTADDWQVNADGSLTMTLTLPATHNAYFRLRGTHHGYNDKGWTANGEPQRSPVVAPGDDSQAYYQALNQRNYRDLWFYSNPIFLELIANEAAQH